MGSVLNVQASPQLFLRRAYSRRERDGMISVEGVTKRFG